MAKGKAVVFNQDTLKLFKKHYAKAKKDGCKIFIFEGNEWLTSYAKYTIEYLEANML